MINEKNILKIINNADYEEISPISDLYSYLETGIEDINNGNLKSFVEAIAEIRNRKQSNLLHKE